MVQIQRLQDIKERDKMKKIQTKVIESFNLESKKTTKRSSKQEKNSIVNQNKARQSRRKMPIHGKELVDFERVRRRS